MKRMLFVILLFIPIYLFCEEGAFNINEEWVKAKSNSRSYFEKRKVLELDTETLTFIQNSNIPSDVEPVLSDLLYEILCDNKLDNVDNCNRVIDILEKQFKNKNHLFRVSSEFSYYNSVGYPFIIAKIFSSLKNIILDDFDENVRAFKVIYTSIKEPYVLGAKNGTVKYGTSIVQQYLKAYLDEVPKLLAEGKLNDYQKSVDTVMRISGEVGVL